MSYASITVNQFIMFSPFLQQLNYLLVILCLWLQCQKEPLSAHWRRNQVTEEGLLKPLAIIVLLYRIILILTEVELNYLQDQKKLVKITLGIKK